MNGIRMKICRETSPYGKVPQNRFWFVPNCEWSILVSTYVSKECTIVLPTILKGTSCRQRIKTNKS